MAALATVVVVTVVVKVVGYNNMPNIIYNKTTLTVQRIDASPIAFLETVELGVHEDATVAVAWPSSPGRWATLKFINNAMVWVDSRPLADIKAAQWEAIKALRDRRKASGVKVGPLWFHSDADSRTQQLGLVIFGAGLPVGLQWKTMGGTFVTMTPVLTQQIFGETAMSDQATFAKAEFHKAAMEASSDPQAYDFTTGWPPIYGE